MTKQVRKQKIEDRHNKPSTSIAKTRHTYHRFLSRSRGVVDIQRDRIYKMAQLSGMLGESLDELAARIKIPTRILGVWMIKDKNIAKSMRRGMDGVVVEVERALLKRAKGYDHPVTDRTEKRDITGKVVEKTVKHTTIHVPPDPSMIKYVLSKRLRKRYQEEKQEAAHIIINMDADDRDL